MEDPNIAYWIITPRFHSICTANGSWHFSLLIYPEGATSHNKMGSRQVPNIDLQIMSRQYAEPWIGSRRDLIFIRIGSNFHAMPPLNWKLSSPEQRWFRDPSK